MLIFLLTFLIKEIQSMQQFQKLGTNQFLRSTLLRSGEAAVSKGLELVSSFLFTELELSSASPPTYQVTCLPFSDCGSLMGVSSSTKFMYAVACACSFSFNYFLMVYGKCTFLDKLIKKLSSIPFEDLDSFSKTEGLSFSAHFLEMLLSKCHDPNQGLTMTDISNPPCSRDHPLNLPKYHTLPKNG